jgi:hypothetical protein
MRTARRLSGVDDIQAQAVESYNDSPSASLPVSISISASAARSSTVEDDVEANWSDNESRPFSEDVSTHPTADSGSSVRDLSSTVSTVIWRGVEAVKNTTGFQRRPPEDVDRDR